MASAMSANLWQPEGAYDSLATVTLSATTSSITFAGIPSTYKHLQIRGIGRSSTASDYSNNARFNGDTSASYAYHWVQGNGTSATSSNTFGDTFMNMGQLLPLSSQTASAFGTFVMDILDYSNTTKNKTARTLAGFDVNGGGIVLLSSGLYAKTDAINSITLYPSASASYPQYSTFALYGIK
jgi:hypothetical protein